MRNPNLNPFKKPFGRLAVGTAQVPKLFPPFSQDLPKGSLNKRECVPRGDSDANKSVHYFTSFRQILYKAENEARHKYCECVKEGELGASLSCNKKLEGGKHNNKI